MIQSLTSRTERKIPIGICSMPLSTRADLKKHFKMLSKRNLCPIVVFTITPKWAKGKERTRIRRNQLLNAIKHIELICGERALRLMDNIICFSRVSRGFAVWGIGMSISSKLVNSLVDLVEACIDEWIEGRSTKYLDYDHFVREYVRPGAELCLERKEVIM